MTKNTKYKKRLFKKYYKTIKIAISLFILISIILVAISIKFSPNIIKTVKYTPTNSENETNHLQAEIYFNNQKLDKSFEEILAQEISQAENSLEIAIYSFNIEALRDEIYRAADRGVKVKIILSKNKEDQHNNIFSDNIPKNVKIVSLGEEKNHTFSQYMHHKFIIIDRNTKKAKLLTGSVNLTELQIIFDPSYLFITTDKNIIKTYGQEFDRLIQNYSGPNKLKLKDYKPWASRINYNDSFLDIYFSPGFRDNNINNKIIELIKSAKDDIKIMAWQISDQEIAKAIIYQAKYNKKITIITDDFNFADKYSIFPSLLKAKEKYNLNNLEIITDTWKTVDLYDEIPDDLININLFNSFFHHHCLIIDNNLTLFGTNNWSKMGAKINDENIMITNDQEITRAFLNTFSFHYKDLREKKIEIKLKDNQIIINNTDKLGANSYENINITVLGFNTNINEKPQICLNEKINKTNNTFSLPENCKNYFLDIYMHNSDGDIKGGDIIINNSK